MAQFNVIYRSQPDQPIENHHDELPYGTTIWSPDPQVYKLDHRDSVLTHTLSLPTDESKIATHKHKIEFDRTICTPFIISTGCSLEYTVMEMVVNCRQLARSDLWQVFGEIVLKCYFDVASLLQHSIPSTTNLGYIYSQTTHLR